MLRDHGSVFRVWQDKSIDFLSGPEEAMDGYGRKFRKDLPKKYAYLGELGKLSRQRPPVLCHWRCGLTGMS